MNFCEGKKKSDEKKWDLQKKATAKQQKQDIKITVPPTLILCEVLQQFRKLL